jgi:competence protein ComEC
MFFIRLRYKNFHASYLVTSLCAGTLIGLALGRSIISAEYFVIIIMTALILIVGAFKSRRWWALIIVVFAGVLLGFVRASGEQDSYHRYNDLIGKPVTIYGKVSSDTERQSAQQRFTIGAIKTSDGTYYPGQLYVSTIGSKEVKRGDTITIVGTLTQGFGTYPASINGAKLLSLDRSADMVRDARERFSLAVRQAVIEPMASLGLGFVVGQRSALPSSLDTQLKVVGLTHIVVASGYNLTILVRFMMRLLSRHSRYLAFTSSLAVIVLFVLFSGFSPSMNRAVAVTLLSLLAWYVGRRFHPVQLILYVAAGTAFYNPMYVWADLGWYLSFFAFTGILVIGPLATALLYKKRTASSFEQLLIETTSAELMAIPLIAFAFGTIPVFGLIANVLVGPFIPAAMALTTASGIIAMLSSDLGHVVGAAVDILIGYMVAVVEWLSSIRFAQVTFDVSTYQIVGCYMLVVVGSVWAWKKTGYSFKKQDERRLV